MYQTMKSAVLIGLLAAAPALASVSDFPEASPNKAIQIVLDTQGEKIRAVDNPNSWWHDAKERSWSVKRPFEVGIIDSTYTFTVVYKIDGFVAATWNVDTRKGTAVLVP